ELVRISQGNAGSDRTPPRRRDQQGAFVSYGARPPRSRGCRDHAARAPHARTSRQDSSRCDRKVGGGREGRRPHVRLNGGLRPPPPRAGSSSDRDQPILRTQPSLSATSPRWMPTSLAFSAAVIGPPVPSPMTISPFALLISPIAE